MLTAGTKKLAAAIIGILCLLGCRNDDGSLTGTGEGTVRDIDGNVYRTVIFNGQEWMAENLKTTRYRDGKSINYPGDDNRSWAAATSGTYSWYENDTANRDVFGALYNWHAVETKRLCPAGWHVPSDEEWTLLNKHLALNPVFRLKETGTGLWHGVLETGSSIGFTALPGGARYVLNGKDDDPDRSYFFHLGRSGRWWTSVENSGKEAWYRAVHSDCNNIYRGYQDKVAGLSVRCVRNLK